MDFKECFHSCAVLGAAGKMGRGIALLMLQEMAWQELSSYGMSGGGHYFLILIDRDAQALIALKKYLREQLLRYAERRAEALRSHYKGNETLISNREVIMAFVEGALDCVFCSTELAAARPARIIFEALPEDIALKVASLKELHERADREQYIFSNTSSIPIWLLNEQAGLHGNIAGLHFYNPPPQQRLIEVVFLEEENQKLKSYAELLGKQLKKILVKSSDIPGFIGNGFFIREVAFAYQMALKLKTFFGWPESLYAVDFVSRELLVRPMGIFQLVDYVGIDIVHNIATIMATLLNDPHLLIPLIAEMADERILGGQTSSGAPRAGIFSYGSHQQPEAVYDKTIKEYRPIERQAYSMLLEGSSPPPSWKALYQKINIDQIIQEYLSQLAKSTGLGSSLAQAFLQNSKMVAAALVESHVAATTHDVDIVLMEGFHHLYSPFLYDYSC